MKPLVIWDWNNTLVDTMEASFLAMRDVSEYYQVPFVSRDDLMRVIGTHRTYWQTTFGAKEQEAVHYYLKRYACYRDTIKVIQGAKEVLEFVQSKNVMQIILSNEDMSLLVPETEYTGLAPYFTRICGTIDEHGKPEVAFALNALNGLDYDHLILVGDGISDMQMADVLGAVSICVFNNVSTDVLSDYRCQTLDEVKVILQKLL